MEYLKNTVLKLFMTGEAETLLPVFASILALSPDEVQRCKGGLDALQESGGEVPMAAAAAAVDSATSWLGGGWGGWLGGAGANGTADSKQ